MELLNRGVKYSQPHKQKNWIKTLVTENDTPTEQLEEEQDCMRQLVSHNVKELIKKQDNTKDKHLTTKNKISNAREKLVHSKELKLVQQQL
jgi:GTP cyclohydrolase FolE2